MTALKGTHNINPDHEVVAEVASLIERVSLSLAHQEGESAVQCSISVPL